MHPTFHLFLFLMVNRYAFFHQLLLIVWLSAGGALVAQAQTTTCAVPTVYVDQNGTSTTSAAVTLLGATNATSYTVTYGQIGASSNPSPLVTFPSVTGTASPIILTGLVSGTTYQVYVQATCGTSGQSVQLGPLIYTAGCVHAGVYPYTESLDLVAAPVLPCSYSMLDANNDGSGWHNYTATPTSAYSGPNAMRYEFSYTNAADDWFFVKGLQMYAGTTYQLQFKYRAFSGNYPEGLEVKIGAAASPAWQTHTLFTNTNITNAAYATTVAGGSAGQVLSFSPATSGNYYIGFHATSAADKYYLYVDDIQVTTSVATAIKSSVAPGFRAEASPVPFGPQLLLSLNTLQAGPLELTLHDAVGRVVRQHSATVPAGASSVALPEVGTLPAGVYLLTVRQGDNTQVIRVAHE